MCFSHDFRHSRAARHHLCRSPKTCQRPGEKNVRKKREKGGLGISLWSVINNSRQRPRRKYSPFATSNEAVSLCLRDCATNPLIAQVRSRTPKTHPLTHPPTQNRWKTLEKNSAPHSAGSGQVSLAHGAPWGGGGWRGATRTLTLSEIMALTHCFWSNSGKLCKHLDFVDAMFHCPPVSKVPTVKASRNKINLGTLEHFCL